MLVKLYTTLQRCDLILASSNGCKQYIWGLVYAFLQVVRGDIIVFFNQIFDALCKLSADSDPNVQSAAHLLDRLVKVNVVFCLDI